MTAYADRRFAANEDHWHFQPPPHVGGYSGAGFDAMLDEFQSGNLLKQLEVIRGSQATSLKRGVNENSEADDSNRQG